MVMAAGSVMREPEQGPDRQDRQPPGRRTAAPQPGEQLQALFGQPQRIGRVEDMAMMTTTKSASS